MKADSLGIFSLLVSSFLSINCQSICAENLPILYLGDGEEFTLARSHTVQEIRSLSSKVKLLHIQSGADSDILSDRRLFPKLLIVTLNSESNDSFLRDLSLYHNNILVLSIQQSAPLSDKAVSYLDRFKKLQKLELHCALNNPNSLSQFLPVDIDFLSISQACLLPELLKLRHLTMANCLVNASFFAKLNAPNLELLSLTEATPDLDALESLSRFSKLKYLDLPKSFTEQRNSIKNFTQARIRIQGDPIGPPF